jgi:type IV fimbrial biogenesis protein FimT
MYTLAKTRTTQGFTLIESMVAVAVLAVSATIAVPSYRHFTASLSIRTASMDVVSHLLLARSEAVKRNGTISLVPINSDWRNGWQVVHAASSSQVAQAEAMNGDVALQGTQPSMLQFDAEGRLVGASAQQMQLAVAKGGVTLYRCIQLDPAGLPRIKKATCT